MAQEASLFLEAEYAAKRTRLRRNAAPTHSKRVSNAFRALTQQEQSKTSYSAGLSWAKQRLEYRRSYSSQHFGNRTGVD